MAFEHVEANLAVAAYLKAKGYRFRELTPIGRTVYAFNFEDPNRDAREIAAEYQNHGTVEAEKLIRAFGDLKTLLYQAKQTKEKEQNDSHQRATRPNTRPL